MKKIVVGGLVVAVLLAGFVVVTEAKKPKKEIIGLSSLTLQPDTIYADKENVLLATLAAGKRLRKPVVQYRDSAGNWRDLGKLNDKGKDGDAKKGDKTYSLQATVGPDGATVYRAAARKGLRTLLVSPETKLAVRKGDWIVGYEIGDTGVTLDYPAEMKVSISRGTDAMGYFFEDRNGNAFSVSIERGSKLLGNTLQDYLGRPVLPEHLRVINGVECQQLDASLFCIQNGVAYSIENGYGMYSDTGIGGTSIPREIFEQVIQSIRFP